MKEIIKASADWYFDGPGWIAMMLLVSPLIGFVARRRPRFWWPVFIVVAIVLPLGLLLVRHY